ncbi:hypothetical protein WICPIJ_009323 [Wickerhamomyces pijperi]|uniref:MMS19 nucleotide excision repair protein n=1 Tax=Wickerhamomyces pijperi TaxID=599730 RepID=A0A9P8PNY2_WICPI|nr:hypothetical protein WICPIJ_009323 [Wickerhamomyces pijperi]
MTDQTSLDPSYYITQYLSQSQLDNLAPIQSLSQFIIKKELTLLKLIQLLGDYLTADDEVLRALAVALLARVLQELAGSTDDYQFNGNDVKVLLKFMLAKLEEPKAIGEALIGINALISKKVEDEALFSEILTQFKEKYPETGNPASVRYHAFQLLNTLFDHCQGGKFDSEFIQLFIKVASNEKDPRNLLLSFGLNTKIASTMKTTEYHQDLFDLLYCYFPINFKPPKNDPYKITEDQLKGGLKTALAANSLFQDDLLENNLENFSNSNFNYKSDSVDLLCEFFSKPDRDISDANFLKLFQVLKFEVTNINLDDEEDQEMLAELLKLLKSVIRSLTVEQTIKLHEIINDQFFKELNFNNKVLHKNFLFLTAISSTSMQNFNYIFGLTIAELFQNLDHNTSSKRELIKIITLFLDSYSVLPSTESESEVQGDDQLSLQKEKILIFLSDTLMSSSMIEVTLRNLSLIALRGLSRHLTQDETSLLITYYFETLKADTNEHIFKSCITGLNAIQGKNEVLVSELQALIGGLFDEGNNDQYVFRILCGLNNKEVLSVVIEVLLGKFIHIANSENSENIKSCFQIVDNLIQIISGNFRTYQIDLSVFNNLIGFVMNASGSDVILDVDLFERFTDLIKLFVINLNEADQKFLYEDSLKVYNSTGNSEIFQGLSIFESTPDVKVYLLLKCLAGLSVKLFANSEDLNISTLIQFTLTANFNGDFVKLGYLQLLCLLVNKYNYTEIPQLALVSIQEIETHTWITKALLLKMSPLSQPYLDSLVSLLSDSTESSTDYSSIFEILCVDLPLFTPSSSPGKVKINNMRLLYKQKFYGIVIPQLIEKYQSENHEFKYLQALLILMKDDNKELLLSYIDPLFQIFLSSKDQLLEGKEYTKLETFLRFVQISMLKITGFEKYLNSLLNLFQTALMGQSGKASVGLKLTILENISEFLKLNVVEVTKLKTPVLRLLQNLSNDKSRKVRKLNVDVKQQWFELGITASAD